MALVECLFGGIKKMSDNKPEDRAKTAGRQRSSPASGRTNTRFMDPLESVAHLRFAMEVYDYVTARCDLETEEPIYPCRPSKKRERKEKIYNYKSFYPTVTRPLLELNRGVGPKMCDALLRKFGDHEAVSLASVDDVAEVRGISNRLAQEILDFFHGHLVKGDNMWRIHYVLTPNNDESTWTYPTGRFTTWLRTAEIKKALENDHIKKVYFCQYTDKPAKEEREQRNQWSRTRREFLNEYGKKCMRCGTEKGAIHVDHIQQWAHNLEGAYDLENLQVLCEECHIWKTKQERLGISADALNFRPQR